MEDTSGIRESSVIDTTSLSSAAESKLKELDDLLKDYPEEEEESVSQNESPEPGSSSCSNDIVSTVESSTVAIPDNCSDSKDSQSPEISDSSEDEESLIALPNGETVDLTNVGDYRKLIQLFSDTFVSSEKMKSQFNTYKEKERAVEEKSKNLETQVKELQGKNNGLNAKLQDMIQQLSKSQDTLKAHDASARAAINKLQTESDSQIKSLKAKCAAMQKEKEASVMNYARREKEVLDAKRLAEAADKKCKEAAREKERVITQMKSMRMDVGKMKVSLEKQESECTQLKKEAEKWKDESNSQIIKVKWAQNKLKSETDSHNETKEKLCKALAEIKRAKEETEQIRINCQGMIKTYQESEEMRSNSLDSQLKEKEILLSQQEAKSGELEGIHKQQTEEMRKLKQQYKDVLEENAANKTRIECLEKERSKNEETMKGYTEVLNRQKKEAVIMGEKIKELEQIKLKVDAKDAEIKKMEDMAQDQKEYCEELKVKEDAWKEKQQELLEFTQRVSTKNAELTSANEILTSKLNDSIKNFEESKAVSLRLETELNGIKSQLGLQSKNANEVESDLKKRLEDKEATLNLLTTQLDETKDEIRTLKRKHAANVKDLTRQLHHARKKLEPYESSTITSHSGPATEDGSMGSRASSDTSLDCIGKGNHLSNPPGYSHNSAAEPISYSNHSNGTDVPETVVSNTGEISTQTLVERIVRLQRIHARKNEKIDFLHDHVQQLVDELQKKNRIIQHYILREESGMLMASTPHSQVPANAKFSKHLTEEVNRKMQSVLEDTLLKNIALKESVDALGSEIARLHGDKK